MTDLIPLWVGLAALYLGTGVYVRLVYRGLVPAPASLAFVCFGGSIFLFTNSRYVLIPGVDSMELLSVVLLFVAWVAAVAAVREVVEDRRRPADDSVDAGTTYHG